MLTIMIVLHTTLIALLTLLVAGLLRSHADIQATLDRIMTRGGKAGGMVSPDIPVPPKRANVAHASDISGMTPARDSVHLAFSGQGQGTLLAFLTSGCTTCAGFWEAFASVTELPGDLRLIAVTKGPEEESPSRLAAIAPPGVTVVMSSDAWDAFDVPGAPYFVYVDGESGDIYGEGAAVAWNQVESLLSDAIQDAAIGDESPPQERARRPESTYERQCRADAALEAAGIGPDDPSLWGRVEPRV